MFERYEYEYDFIYDWNLLNDKEKEEKMKKEGSVIIYNVDNAVTDTVDNNNNK